MYCLTIPEHIENIKILHMRTQKMNVDFILLGSILAKRNYDSNILRYQKKYFKKICEIMPFLYHKRPETAFSTLFGIPFFSLCCFRNALSILFQRDMKNTVFIRASWAPRPHGYPHFLGGKSCPDCNKKNKRCITKSIPLLQHPIRTK